MKLRVVLVEDNDDIRMMMQALLQRLGCEVNMGSDGPSGIAAVLEHAPDIAFVDIGLPGVDGYGVARAVRARLGDGPLLVAVTGYGQPGDAAKAKEAGFDEHITKLASSLHGQQPPGLWLRR